MEKYLLQNKSLHSPLFALNDFEAIIVETDDKRRLEELRKSKDKLYTKKTIEHVYQYGLHRLFNIQKISNEIKQNIFTIKKRMFECICGNDK